MTESAIPVKGKGPGQHYGGPLGGNHQARPEPKVVVVYENAEIQDLYMRLKKVFAEMGHEF